MTKASGQYHEPYFPSDAPSMIHPGDRVTASSATLMRQAPMTADEYMHSAIDCVDARLGSGYARAHPELIAPSAIDFTAGVIARAIEAVADAIESGRG